MAEAHERLKWWSNPEMRSRMIAGVMLALCSAFPVALMALRHHFGGGIGYRFLLWNLFLAWVPLGFALMAEFGWRRQWSKLVLLAPLFSWLVFFPNAPYVLTDIVHLAPSDTAPLWFDALILFSMGFAGLLVGFVSLRLVQLVISAATNAIIGWVVSLFVLAASGFGIYLGRIARYNSWDLLTRPRTLLYDVTDVAFEPVSNQRTIVTSLLFAAFLVVSYLGMLSLGQLRLPDRINRRAPVL